MLNHSTIHPLCCYTYTKSFFHCFLYPILIHYMHLFIPIAHICDCYAKFHVHICDELTVRRIILLIPIFTSILTLPFKALSKAPITHLFLFLFSFPSLLSFSFSFSFFLSSFSLYLLFFLHFWGIYPLRGTVSLPYGQQ